jgi:predicted ATPase/tRNA A-37 threonylcarbamoyl transferase component Bud32
MPEDDALNQLQLTLSEQQKQLRECQTDLDLSADDSSRERFRRLHEKIQENITELETALSVYLDTHQSTPSLSITGEESTRAFEKEKPYVTGFTPTRGEVLSNTYRLDKVLGKGGMGEVWLATHLLLNEPRAIKLVLDKRTNDSASRERFIQGEARHSLRLIHPNIVRVHDLGQHQEAPFIVMEYVQGHSEGSDLKSLLRNKGKFSPQECGRLLEQLASALEQAHRQGLVHCDLKPANILLTDSGDVKISDFGLVRDLATSSDTGEKIAGTPVYMSPEQSQGQVDARSDLYSLGIILYELMTGRPPFTGNPNSVIIQHSILKPIPPRLLNPDIPESISEIILKCLAKSPEDRYSAVSEMAAAFREALMAEQPSSPPETLQTPNNLPVKDNRLLGRKRELADLVGLLKQSETRLVTLTGVGGTGKTRLSLEVAAELLTHFSGGVYFVALENTGSREMLILELAQVLKLKESKGQNLLESVKAFLKEKNLLLLLDNFEQLVACSGLLPELLETSKDLKILVTSRVILKLPEEKEYKVAPLAVPEVKNDSPQALMNYAAVALFVERAQEIRKSFALTRENAPQVAEICIRLDGLPLALELAAARAKLLSPQQILERLSDRFKLLTGSALELPARQSTLRTTIDWSFVQLEPAEKTLFVRLSVFAGGFTVEAAEKVCNPRRDLAIEVLEGLESLTSKSLLREITGKDGVPRCAMLQTIREYALEKLQQSGEAEDISLAHASFFAELAESNGQRLKAQELQAALNLFDTEYDNFRQALDWSVEHNGTVLAHLCASLWRFWTVRSYFSEGKQYLDYALDFADELLPEIRARIFNAAGSVAHNSGDYPVAITYFKQALDLFHSLGNRQMVGLILTSLGRVADNQGDYKTAEAYFLQSLTICRELNDIWNAAVNLNNLGNITSNRGDYSQAEIYYRESLELMRLVGDKAHLASAFNNLGNLAAYRGDLDTAYRYYLESLNLRREVGDRLGVSYSLTNLGAVAYVQKNYPLALTYYLEGLQIRRELGEKFGIAASLTNLGLLAYKQESYSEGLDYFRESLELKKNLSDKYGIAVALLGIAGISARLGVQHESDSYLWYASRICGALTGLMAQINGVLQPSERALYDEVEGTILSKLSEPVYQTEFLLGEQLSLDTAIELAMQNPAPVA